MQASSSTSYEFERLRAKEPRNSGLKLWVKGLGSKGLG